MAVMQITKDNFQKEVMESDRTVLLDFFAGWCGPCRIMAPAVDKVAESNPDIFVGKVDVDDQRELAAKYNIVSIPTLVVIRNGETVTQSTGVKTKKGILSLLEHDPHGDL